ncbi:hypothetical protein FACS189487_03040 [Campylobacterota bacterium]|nr:hypothetical protein FACS189487_03040 [Campylobacterota bacterium]
MIELILEYRLETVFILFLVVMGEIAYMGYLSTKSPKKPEA